MKTPITKQIADRLEELAIQWKDHTSQAEALMMAAKEVMTFPEKEKEQIMDAHSDGAYHTDWDENTDVIENAQDYYNETLQREMKTETLTTINTPNYVGGYRLGTDHYFQLNLTYKPNWFHRTMMRLCFGYKWINL